MGRSLGRNELYKQPIAPSGQPLGKNGLNKQPLAPEGQPVGKMVKSWAGKTN